MLNLASRALALSFRRLSRDWHHVFGYPVLPAESFADPNRFSGTRYRVANLCSLGFMRDLSSASRDIADWSHHGQAQEIFLFELVDNARAALCQATDGADWNVDVKSDPVTAQL